MPYTSVNGIKIYYEVHGTGHPLLMIQGFTRNSLCWQPMIEKLKDKYQIIILDNRGSGRSQHPSPPYNMDMLAKDVVELLKTLNIPKVSIFGHSMGGAIAMQLCLDHPDLVEKIIICSSFAKVPYTSLMQIDTFAQMAIADVPIEFIYEIALPWLFSSKCLEIPGHPEMIIEKMVKDPHPQEPEGYMGQGEALKQFDISSRLSEIKKPCLIMVGKEDLYAPVSCSEFMKENIEKAQMKIIPHQGHMVNEEFPELICHEIQTFLGS